MFGLNKKNKESEAPWYDINGMFIFPTETQKAYYDWCASEEYNRLNHLETLIIKTFETVNIKVESLYKERLNESFTREDYLEDYKVFFKPEVFNKLREWCKEYEFLRKHEQEILEK